MLSKRELELIRRKEELKEKMKKADIYFTRMKRCRGSKNTDLVGRLINVSQPHKLCRTTSRC